MNRKKHHPHHEQPAAAPGAPEASAPAASPATPPLPATLPPPAPAPAELELAAQKDKYLRLLADFDNFRKRQTRDREEHTHRATEALMEELLPVLDHLQLALASAPGRTDSLASGVQLVVDQFLAALARFDLKPFTAVGEPFDPTRHEAVSELASDTVPAQHVLHQLRSGYWLGNRLLRPAQVVISRGPPDPAARHAAEDGP